MSMYITKVVARGVHRRFDIDQNFLPRLNILFGRNGTGKTTLLHIIANVLNGDYKRFVFLEFQEISVTLSDTTTITIIRDNDEIHVPHLGITFPIRETEQELTQAPRQPVREETYHPVIRVDYFPAFRNMIEAWVTVPDTNVMLTRLIREMSANLATRSPVSATHFARELFGDFVPRLSYPSPIEIGEKLTEEIRNARLEVGKADRNLLSQSFQEIYKGLAEERQVGQSSEDIMQEIREFSKKLQETSSLYETEPLLFAAELRDLLSEKQLREESVVTHILDVYRTSLQEMLNVQEREFATVRKYLDSVNQFLEGKKLEIKTIKPPNMKRSLIALTFDDGTSNDMRALSSGERQIVSLIYAATHMRKEEVVLIDEPEISLHIDWQRKLLPEMTKQLADRQIIACTHSPEIGAEYGDDTVFILSPQPTRTVYQGVVTCDVEDEEEVMVE